MNPPIQAIIFDMDGTMVDNMAVHNRIWIDYLQDLGAAVDPTVFHERTAGRTNTEVLRMYLGEGLSTAEARQLSEEKEERYRAYFKAHVRPVAGLMDLLRAARQAGYRLGVATSAPSRNVDFLLGCLGLDGFFDAVVHGEEVARGKPDPEIFLKAAERLGVPPAACLVFEDARMGAEAARRAGMRTILLTTTLPAGEAGQVPGVVKAVADFREVLTEI